MSLISYNCASPPSSLHNVRKEHTENSISVDETAVVNSATKNTGKQTKSLCVKQLTTTEKKQYG